MSPAICIPTCPTCQPAIGPASLKLENTMVTTVIEDADWAIVWQASPGRHVYMRGVDVVFDGNTIT
jgi:hypothetical protein